MNGRGPQSDKLWCDELTDWRITSVPWDQLRYSQVDNFLLTRLPPWMGEYGISFVLVAVNALLRLHCCRGSVLMALVGTW